MFRQRVWLPVIALLSSLLECSYAASENVFTSNPTSNSTGVPVWRVGDIVTVTWNTSLSPINIGYVHSFTQDTFYTIYRPTDASSNSYNWTVDVNASTWTVGSTTMYLGIQDASTGKSNAPFYSTPFTVLPASAPAPTIAAGNNSQAASERPTEQSSVPIEKIVGPAVAGGLVLGGLSVLAVVCFLKRRKQKKGRKYLTNTGAAAWQQGHQKRPSASALLTEDGKPRDEGERAKKLAWMNDDEEKGKGGLKSSKEKELPKLPPAQSRIPTIAEMTSMTPSAGPIPDYQVSLLGPNGEPVSELHGESQMVDGGVNHGTSSGLATGLGLDNAVREKEKKARRANVDVQELATTRSITDFPMAASASVIDAAITTTNIAAASQPLLVSPETTRHPGIGSPSAESMIVSPYIMSPDAGRHNHNNNGALWGVVSPPTASTPWVGAAGEAPGAPTGDTLIADEESGQFYRIINPTRGGRYQHL